MKYQSSKPFYVGFMYSLSIPVILHILMRVALIKPLWKKKKKCNRIPIDLTPKYPDKRIRLFYTSNFGSSNTTESWKSPLRPSIPAVPPAPPRPALNLVLRCHI